MSQDQIRKQLFNVFNPIEALPPNDPRYVECNEVRGSVGLLNTLADSIRFSDEPTCQLLSGNRGCGKTTELLRLRHMLREDASYFVVYCEADDYIDWNDVVEYTDVLLAMLQQLGRDAAQHGIQLASGRFQTFLRGLWDIYSAYVKPDTIMKPDTITLNFVLVELGYALKRNPNYRQLVRDHLRPRAADFLQAVNEQLEHAAQAFRDNDARCAGLVVTVDNLDRMLRQTVPNINRTSHDILFVDAASQLSDVACHVIYTLPPALLHSPSGANLAQRYGTVPHMLPMIPVTTRTGADDEQGVTTLLDAIQARLRFAGAASAFDAESTLRRLCTASGGYIRNLMTLARQATLHATELPIGRDAVEQTIRDMRDTFIRGTRPSQWPILSQVAATKQIDKSEDCLELLDNLAVLEYRDGAGPWYDVNPVVREAQEFTA